MWRESETFDMITFPNWENASLSFDSSKDQGRLPTNNFATSLILCLCVCVLFFVGGQSRMLAVNYLRVLKQAGHTTASTSHSRSFKPRDHEHRDSNRADQPGPCFNRRRKDPPARSGHFFLIFHSSQHKQCSSFLSTYIHTYIHRDTAHKSTETQHTRAHKSHTTHTINTIVSSTHIPFLLNWIFRLWIFSFTAIQAFCPLCCLLHLNSMWTETQECGWFSSQAWHWLECCV